MRGVGEREGRAAARASEPRIRAARGGVRRPLLALLLAVLALALRRRRRRARGGGDSTRHATAGSAPRVSRPAAKMRARRAYARQNSC